MQRQHIHPMHAIYSNPTLMNEDMQAGVGLTTHWQLVKTCTQQPNTLTSTCNHKIKQDGADDVMVMPSMPCMTMDTTMWRPQCQFMQIDKRHTPMEAQGTHTSHIFIYTPPTT